MWAIQVSPERLLSYLELRKFKVALKPLQRNFFNFSKSCILKSLFNNERWGLPDSFLSYMHLKKKLRMF